MEAAGFEVRCQIIWAKNTFAWGFGRYKFQHEPIFYGHVAGEKDPWYGDKSQSTLWEEKKPAANRLHPTMKPVELVERALINSSKSGDIVVDLFGGSGSTLIGCERTGRKARLAEIDPRYADVIVRRWQDYTGKKATLDDDGRLFQEVGGGSMNRTLQSGDCGDRATASVWTSRRGRIVSGACRLVGGVADTAWHQKEIAARSPTGGSLPIARRVLQLDGLEDGISFPAALPDYVPVGTHRAFAFRQVALPLPNVLRGQSAGFLNRANHAHWLVAAVFGFGNQERAKSKFSCFVSRGLFVCGWCHLFVLLQPVILSICHEFGVTEGLTRSVVKDIDRKSPVIITMTISKGVKMAWPVITSPTASSST